MMVRDSAERERVAGRRSPAGLPPDAEVMQVAFVEKGQSGQQVLLVLPATVSRVAVTIGGEAAGSTTGSPVDLQVLTIPASKHDEAGLLAAARDWAGSDRGDAADSPVGLMTLQGAQVFWTSRRVAIIAPADRLEALRRSLVEAFWYQSELLDLERSLADLWPQMELDLPLAFAFEEQAIRQKRELQDRFQQVLRIRARLARLRPFVHCPHLYPPTLASQVNERFRERNQMIHRHDFLHEQVQVFGDVYDACGQRASEFIQSRTGHMLEWGIVILLGVEVLLMGFDLLTSTG
jgi:hypothetical protein